MSTSIELKKLSENMDIKEQNVCLQQNESDGPVKIKYLQSFWSNITLEPFWFGCLSSFLINAVAYKNFYLHRACTVNLNYSEEFCEQALLNASSEIELKSQEIVSVVMTSSSFFATVITLLITIFIAPWSDKSGKRKPLILLSVTGLILGSISLLVMQFFPQMNAGSVIYTHNLLLALGGHFPLLFLATFNYLGDICYKTGRCVTTVMGSNNGFLSLSMVIGTLLCPILINKLNMIGIFAVCCLFEASSLIYVIIFVKDINVSETKTRLFDISHPVQTLKCVFKRREGYKRRNILLMLMIPCCNTVLYNAEIAMAYMYFRNKFSWDGEQYSAFLTIKMILFAVGSFLVIGVKRKFNLRDRYIGIIGAVSQMLGYVSLMLSKSTLAVFLTTLTGVLSRGVVVAERPVLFKQINADEQGKISCVAMFMEKIIAMPVLPLISYIYSKTLETYPEMVFMINVLLSSTQVLCYAFIKSNVVINDVEH